MQLRIHNGRPALGAAAAREGAACIREAIARTGAASIVVATGSSQFEVLEALVGEPDIDWSAVTGFHLDEYIGLPLSHPASFRGYLKERFVDLIAGHRIAGHRAPLKEFHYINGESEPEAECARVGQLIREHDIAAAFIGIGENGHIAFNDPPADFDTEEPYLVVELDEACRKQQLGEGWFPTLDDVPRRAISMSVHRIMQSRKIVCSVPDQRKARAVADTVGNAPHPDVPSTMLNAHPDCTLHLDEAAASLLPPGTCEL